MYCGRFHPSSDRGKSAASLLQWQFGRYWNFSKQRFLSSPKLFRTIFFRKQRNSKLFPDAMKPFGKMRVLLKEQSRWPINGHVSDVTVPYFRNKTSYFFGNNRKSWASSGSNQVFSKHLLIPVGWMTGIFFSLSIRGRSEASQVDFLNSFARGDSVFLGLLNPR